MGFFVILYSFSDVDKEKFDAIGQNMAKAFKSNSMKTEDVSLESNMDEEVREIRALHLLVSMLQLGPDMKKNVALIEAASMEKKSEAAVNQYLDSRLKDLGKSLAHTTQKLESNLPSFDFQLADQALFDKGSAELTTEAFKKLRVIGSRLAQTPGLESIEVVGHTDSNRLKPDSPFKTNFVLSSLRAGAVAEAFIQGGIAREKLRVSGMGDLMPLIVERDSDGRIIPANQAKNRRVQIILKKLNHDPP
jgi:chemotaxis protein MotB